MTVRSQHLNQNYFYKRSTYVFEIRKPIGPSEYKDREGEYVSKYSNVHNII